MRMVPCDTGMSPCGTMRTSSLAGRNSARNSKADNYGGDVEVGKVPLAVIDGFGGDCVLSCSTPAACAVRFRAESFSRGTSIRSAALLVTVIDETSDPLA